jgi:hypothetical protein
MAASVDSGRTKREWMMARSSFKNNFPAYARDWKPYPLTVNCSDGTSVRLLADRP